MLLFTLNIVRHVITETFLIIRSAVAPKILPFSFGDDAHEFGNSVQIQCVATEGDTPIQFFWSFSSAEPTTLTQNGVSTMKLGERSSILIIDKIEHNHSGKYTCLAKNKVANSSYTASLLVKGIRAHFYAITAEFAIQIAN